MSDSFPYSDTAEVYDSTIRGIALPRDRKIQERGTVKLPAKTIVVSADNHWSPSTDLFFERAPARMKDRMPRISDDGIHQFCIKGEQPLGPTNDFVQGSYETIAGNTQMEARLRDLDIQGIDKEIVFPNIVPPQYYTYPDLEVREWIFRIYNQYLAESQTLAPGRFYGVAILPWWDMARVREEIAEVKALGFKTLLLPQVPKVADRQPVNYAAMEMDPLFEAIEEADLPIVFHAGEHFSDGPGATGVGLLMNFGPFRKVMAEFIFGGILDRHPKLQVAFIEGEINWVPGAIQTAAMGYECYKGILQPQIKHHPRHYWHNNLYASFTHDPAGLRMLDILGADRVMWSSDYPHMESTLGYSWDSIKCVLDSAASEDDARMVLGGTAMKLFKLD